VSVYDDYQNGRWSRYFLANFLHNHLCPNTPVPLGGHKESRQRARGGNLALNDRGGNALNSLIYDFDATNRVFQVLRLMQEVDKRNEDGFYEQQLDAAVPVHLFRTGDAYYVQTTARGSRHDLAYDAFLYGVVADEDGRYVINHYDGLAD
jgi:hypothetical protein